MRDVRARFPGLADGWARFDGPGGTQLVDTAIDAVRHYLAGGLVANAGGFFRASEETDDLVETTRATLGWLFGADPRGFVFGPNATSLVFAFTRSVARTLRPGDEVVCTTLDHDANVAPWLLAARDAGATVRMARFDIETGRLPVEAVAEVVGDRTRWVAVTGASNALGTRPDLRAVAEVAHAAGAMVAVDAVHLAPHAPIDVGALGCDVVVTSPYKWYGPHAGVLWARPELLAEMEPYKVRPAPDTGPDRWQTGTASFESIAGTRAAAEFLLDLGMDDVAAYEAALFEPLLAALQEMPHVTVYGPAGLDDRTPTVSFNVAGLAPADVAKRLAGDRVAVWSGHYYAWEAIRALGLHESGGAVRAGISRYTSADDVARLVAALSRFCS